MNPVTVTLNGESACFLLLALKEELARKDLSETAARVYEEVIAAIVAGLDQPAAARAASRG